MRSKQPARPALLPFSWIFGGIVRLRNYLYDTGRCRVSSFDIPLISIGNISVGGTGKTPHTEYLVDCLIPDYKLAVLSRGYKRQSKGFALAKQGSTVEEIGDEALQIAEKFPEITVAVHENRVRGIEILQQVKPNIEVILLDDAFQHRRLKTGLSIVLVDYRRPVYEDYLLPAGNLRETPEALSRADLIICSKCPPNISKQEMKHIASNLKLNKRQELFFSGIGYGKLRASFPKKAAYTAETKLEDLRKKECDLLCFCGIASPDNFLKHIREFFPKAPGLVFPDHHEYKAKDVAKIQEAFDRLKGSNKCIITTQKDHMHLRNHPLFDSLSPYIYYIEIGIHFLDGQEQAFKQQINTYVRSYSTNPSMA